MTHYLGDNTFLTAISHGWGLTIRCNACKEQKRWSDVTLADKFLQQINVEVASLEGRLKCECGSRDAVLSFYHAGTYEGSVSDVPDAIASREKSLLEKAAKAGGSGPTSYASAKMRS